MKQKKAEAEKVEVDVIISDETMLIIARYAHSQDITINEAINRLLWEHIESLEQMEKK
jgi:hypothetical protein